VYNVRLFGIATKCPLYNKYVLIKMKNKIKKKKTLATIIPKNAKLFMKISK
jgi:hypothetical protein